MRGDLKSRFMRGDLKSRFVRGLSTKGKEMRISRAKDFKFKYI